MAVAVGFLAAGAVFAALGWLVWAGFAGGDHPCDPRSRVVPGLDARPVMVVTNPGPATVVVGMSWSGGLGWPGLIRWLAATTTVGRPRRGERRRPDRGAVTVLGAVPAGSQGRWVVEPPSEATGCRVVLGLAGGRLRVDQHRTSRRAGGARAIPVGPGRGRRPLSTEGSDCR
jgi:hypothetical protein